MPRDRLEKSDGTLKAADLEDAVRNGVRAGGSQDSNR